MKKNYVVSLIVLLLILTSPAYSQSWTSFTETNSGIPASSVYDLAIDTNNLLWVATTYGLGKFDSLSWTVYRDTNSGIPITSNNTCYAVFVDDSQYVWLGTDYGHLLKFDGDTTWIDFTSVGFGDVHTIRQDLWGNMWVGHYYGVMKFDGNTWTDFTSYLPNYYVNCIETDADSNIWIGTNAGLAKYQPDNTWATYTSSNSPITNDNIQAIGPAPDGINWIGTNDGIYRLDTLGNWTKYNTSNSPLWDDEVNSIEIDSDSIVWISNSSASIAAFHQNVWSNVFFPMNISFARVILIDLHGMKWVGTQSGLARYDDGGAGPIYTNVSGSPLLNETVVYPNPCNNEINIQFNLQGKCRLELLLYNSSGALAGKSSMEIEAGRQTVNYQTGDLPNGLYYLQILSPSFNSSNKILISR